LQWSRLSESEESPAARQTNNVDLAVCRDADSDQPAVDTECNPDERQPHVINPAPAPVSAVRLSSRCVLLTYFDGDVASNIDEHFTRSLKAAATRYESKYRVTSLHSTIRLYVLSTSLYLPAR